MYGSSVKFDGKASISSFRSISVLLLCICVSVSAQNNVSCPDAAPNTVYTNTGGTNYSLFCGYDWTQNIVDDRTDTFEDCLLLCDSFVPAEGQFACGAVAFLESAQRCYLKPSMADGGRLGAKSTGVNTGVKGVPESVTGPPIPACPASNNTIYTDADSHNYTVQCGLDTKGNDYYNASSVPQYSFLYSTNQFGSYQECFYQCGLRPGCLGFTWEGIDGAENGTGRGGCYFKQQANDCHPVIYNFYLDRTGIYNRTYVSALREDQDQLINNTCKACSTTGTVSLCPSTTSTTVLPPQTVSTTSTIASATPSICPGADGTLYTDATGQRYTIYCSDGVSGDSIPLADIPSFDACLLECSKNGSSCGSAVYTSGISYCYLKPTIERSGGADQVGVKYYDVTTTISPTSTFFETTTETTSFITTPLISTTLTASSIASSPSAAPVCLVPDESIYVDSNGQPYRFYCSANWGGNVAVRPEVTSFDACAVECDEYSNTAGSNTCGAVVWNRGSNTCYLKPATGVTIIGTGQLESGNDNVGEKISPGTSTSTSAVSTPFSTTASMTPVLNATPSSEAPSTSSSSNVSSSSTASVVTAVPTSPSSSSELSGTSNSVSTEFATFSTFTTSTTSSTSSLEFPPSNSVPEISTSALGLPSVVLPSTLTSIIETGSGTSGLASVSSLILPPSSYITEPPSITSGSTSSEGLASSTSVSISVVIPELITSSSSSPVVLQSDPAPQSSSSDVVSTSSGSSSPSLSQIVTISSSSLAESSSSSGTSTRSILPSTSPETTPSLAINSSSLSTFAPSPASNPTTTLDDSTSTSSPTVASSSDPDVSFTSSLYSTPTPTPSPETSPPATSPSYPGGTPTPTTSSLASSASAVAACTFTGQQTFNSRKDYEYDVQCGAIVYDDGTRLQLDATASESYMQCFDFCDSATGCEAFSYKGAVAGSGPGTCFLLFKRSDGGGSSTLIFTSGEGTNVAAIRRYPETLTSLSSTTTTTSSSTHATSSCTSTAVSTIVSLAVNTYRTQCGTQISGGSELASIAVEEGSQDCYMFCDANADCVAFSYQNAREICILLAMGSTGGLPSTVSFMSGYSAGFFAAIRVTTPPVSGTSTVLVTPMPSSPQTGNPSERGTSTSGTSSLSIGTISTYLTATGSLQPGCVRRTTVLAVTL